MLPKFIHLHLHSEYSICDGLIRIAPLLQRCITLGMPAIAVTDQSNFFSAVKFYKSASRLGIKPILGVDIWLADKNDEKKSFKLVLLAQNAIGYKNLMHLISRSYLQSWHRDKALIKKIWLTEAAEGIIALSGGHKGDIGQALLVDDFDHAQGLACEWQQIFPNRFYLELQRTGRSGEENYIQKALSLASELNLPLVATNDVLFLDRSDFEAHEARVCIHEGGLLTKHKLHSPYSEFQYLRSPEEMVELFCDIPEAIANTIEIAKRCNAMISLDKNFLPVFPLPEGTDDIEKYFIEQAQAGLQKRFTNCENKTYAKDAYLQRLEREIDIINGMGYASYFLIVADFIRWAKQNDIPVGPGRGSGAGSLVAYALNITDIDPLEHELLFERFLNSERISLPDFDIDFCMDGRDKVIEYVADRYGRERVAQIVTHGTMAAKAVVRDVGRVLGYPYGFVDKIAKLIPYSLGVTLNDALKQNEILHKRYDEDDEVKAMIDLALKIEGTVRNVGKHAGGVVIAPTLLTDFTPLYSEPDAREYVVTQYDKDDIEAIGLVKFDFLGLRTLTILDATEKDINRKRAEKNHPHLDISSVPLNDAATYRMLQTCATTAVFQLESRGMKDLIKRLQPDCFDDIVALVALFRPGPLQSGMVDDFIDRKYGRAQVFYFHPKLEPILRATYGVILYQEQVMQIAQVLAGYSLGSADILRSAMGKKKPEEMARQRAIFIEGAAKRNVDKHVANNIFDLMEKFAGYGFNKSHSVAYAMLAYRTAWLKTHYPAEFMAVVLSSDLDRTDKIVKLIAECKTMGLKIIPPDINDSSFRFTVNRGGEIVYGLGAIKGVGQAGIENMLANRKIQGDFKNIFDLCKRIDRRKVNRRALEALIKCGALDRIGPSRSIIFASLDKALKSADRSAQIKQQGQLSLLDELTAEEKDTISFDAGLYVNVSEWSEEERLNNEKSTLGFYLNGHPVERYSAEINQFISASIAKIAATGNDIPIANRSSEPSTSRPEQFGLMRDQQSREPKWEGDKSVIAFGLITSLRLLLTKSNKHLAIATLEDATGNIEAIIFPETYFAAREILAIDQMVVIEGAVDTDAYTGNARLRADNVLSLEQAREKYAVHLLLKISETFFAKSTIDDLLRSLKPFLGGSCPLCLEYLSKKSDGREDSTKLSLGDEWRVRPKDQLLAELEKNLGRENVVIKYRK